LMLAPGSVVQAMPWRLKAAERAPPGGVPFARVPSSSSTARMVFHQVPVPPPAEGKGPPGWQGEGAGGAGPRRRPRTGREGPAGAGAGAGEVAVGEVPHRLGGDVRLAVHLAAAGAGAEAAARLGEVGDRRRGVRDVLGEVQVADAGAGGAGVAVAAAVAAQK